MTIASRRALVSLVAASTLAALAPAARAATATTVTFTFDTAPTGVSMPFSLTRGHLRADFSAPMPGSAGHSIQPANTMGFTPQGFSGNCLYPNSVFPSDVAIAFAKPLTAIRMKYAPEEYATDSSATMQVTAYLGAALVGSAKAVAPVPGTWPLGILKYTAPAGASFDHVVVHYLSPPPTGGDYGPIFMLDDVKVTLAP